MISQIQINAWVDEAVKEFWSIMPSADALPPIIKIGSPVTLRRIRTELVELTGSKNVNMKEPYTSAMETLHGEKGTAILINQKVCSNTITEFKHEFWHEMGHYYSIQFEPPEFASLDGQELKPDRVRQEGFWMWREFIAESISCYVQGNGWEYKEEFKREHHWKDLAWQLKRMLLMVFETYQVTVDEYALAFFFARLLMDAPTKAFVTDALNNDLLIWDPRRWAYVPMKPDSIEPTQISTAPAMFHEVLMDIMDLLEEQLQKEVFWKTDVEFLDQLGQLIMKMNEIRILALSGRLTQRNANLE